MGVTTSNVSEWLAGYDKSKITIGVVASHSSLQILHGARQEGFQTLGIVVGEERKRYYSAFPGADPDEWLVLDNYAQLLDWSSKNLNQAEKDAFNDTIDNGSTEQVKIAVQGLMSRAGMSPDNAQQNLFEGDVNVTNTDTLGSVAQVTDAMNDPRYSKDPAYRKEVEEKLARSSVI